VKEWVTIVGYTDGTQRCVYYKRHKDAKEKERKKRLAGCTLTSCPNNDGWGVEVPAEKAAA
jgi:hypothetical protein